MLVDSGPAIPRYGEASLADLVPSLLSALGVAGFENRLQIEPAAGVCLLLVDGLGWELLRAHAADAPFLAGLAAAASPLTAGFPSTTAASLASIGTGLAPGEHGFVGYAMAIPRAGRVLNSLTWQVYAQEPPVDLREEIKPETLQPRPTAFERAAADGVTIALIGPGSLSRSGLTRAVFRGGQYRSSVGLGDLASEAALALAQPGRNFVYAYHADLDATGHLRGVDSDAWRLQLSHVDRLAASLAERLPSNTVLLITGDHGMVDLRPEERIDIDSLPGLASGLRCLAGEARARHVHTVPGAEIDVLAAWQTLLGDRMWVFSREEAIASGLFGPRVLTDVRARVGDVVALARERIGIMQRSVDARQVSYVGHHGSVTAAEQLVPMLLVRGG